MSDKVFLGQRMGQLDTSPPLEAVSKVILAVSDDTAYIAGDDTGRSVEITNPYGTQTMANNILQALKNYTYTPAMATEAILDPAAELGDGITMGGVYTVLAQSTLTFDGLMTSDAGAPGQGEQESEYQYQSPILSDIEWQFAETRSQITKTADEIRLEVENEIKGLSASITVQLDSITSEIQGLDGQVSSITQTVSSITSQITGLNGQVSTIQQTVGSITTQITGINGEISSLEQTATSLQTQIRNAQGDISSIEQYVDSITLSVTNGSDSSTIQLKAGSTTISSANITFNGMVTFNDLSTAGSTVINGANITTGTISADRINLTGAITWGDLDNSVQNDINDAISTAEDAYQIASGIELPSYIKDTYIDSTRIESPTIIAGEFYGNEFNVYPQSGSQGSFNLYGDTSQSSGFHMLEISYYWGDGAFVDFGSPAGAIARWEFGSTRFNGTTISFEPGTDVSFNGAVDFSRANVTGLYMVFD